MMTNATAARADFPGRTISGLSPVAEALMARHEARIKANTVTVLRTEFPRGTKLTVFAGDARLYSTYSESALANWLRRNRYEA